jgi:hypothetical protein
MWQIWSQIVAIPDRRTTPMALRKNQSGIRMWSFSEMPLSSAIWLSNLANTVLIGSLVAGLIATFMIVQTGNVKEHHWDIEREQSKERIAQFNKETEKLKAENLALEKNNAAAT